MGGKGGYPDAHKTAILRREAADMRAARFPFCPVSLICSAQTGEAPAGFS